MSGRDYYLRGVDEYRHADWAAAHKDLEAAIANGYSQKPSLYEDAPQTYLQRMDSRDKASPRVAMATPTAAAPAAVRPGDAAADAALNVSIRAEDLQKEQATQQSKRLVAEARTAQLAGQRDVAREKYAEAVHLDPVNAAAQAGLDQLLAEEGRSSRTPNLLNQQAEVNNVRIGEITYRFTTSINDAQRSIQEKNWPLAEANLQRAQLAAGADRAIFPPETLRGFDTTINATRLAIDQGRERERLDLQQKAQTGAAERIKREQDASTLERARTIRDLKDTAKTLMKQNRFREAIGVVDQILVLDVTDEYAIAVRPMLEDKWQFQVQRGVNELRNRKVTDTLNATD